jgi:Ca-activated chloride channel homolog
MKTIFLFLAASLLFTDLDKIGKINSAKAEAKKAFLSGDFKKAIQKYSYLIDSLGVNEDEVRANLASAYFQANDTAHAVNTYQQLTQSPNKKISSVANQQLGVMANNIEKLEEALQYFKQALKAAPENDEARYNYEVVKKKLEEKKKQQQENKDQKDQDKKDDQKKDQNKDQKKDQKDQKDKDKKEQEKKDQEKKDQEKKDQEKKDQKDKDKDQKDQKSEEQKEKEKKEKEQKEQKEKEQQQKDEKNKDKKDIPPSVSDKLKDMQITEEKAKMILEAMKNQEVQYLQQNKRKATKPKDKGKPDW